MTQDEWVMDRILFRAKKIRLFEKRCIRADEMSSEQKGIIFRAIPNEITPVILFWENANRWTVLGTRSISSCTNGTVVTCGLDEIKKCLRPVSVGQEVENIDKFESEYISLEKVGISVWAPSGGELLALMNILLMFPVKLLVKDL